jgi:biopolymer transport protein ExbB
VEERGKQPAAGAAGASGSAFSAPTQVMAAIAEALVATAIGLAVAIPAVAMYNYFHRLSRSILANTDALSHVLLSHLVADPVRNEARTTGNAE